MRTYQRTWTPYLGNWAECICWLQHKTAPLPGVPSAAAAEPPGGEALATRQFVVFRIFTWPFPYLFGLALNFKMPTNISSRIFEDLEFL